MLEAETLIDDHLKGEGKGRYIIEDDESSRLDRVVAFFGKLTQLRSAMILRFGQPLDPFCNPVDEDGQSIAPSGRPVDPASYVKSRGVATVDPARDAGYTRELGEAIAREYQRATVILWTQLVAHILYRYLVQQTPEVDMFGRQRMRGSISMPREQLLVELGEARDRLLEFAAEGRVVVGPVLQSHAPERILAEALTAWNGYHTHDVARQASADIVIEDPNLLLFYQNRLVAFAEDLATPETMVAARTIAATGGRP